MKMDAQVIITILGAALAGSFILIGYLTTSINKIRVEMAKVSQKLDYAIEKIEKLDEVEREVNNVKLHIAQSGGPTIQTH